MYLKSQMSSVCTALYCRTSANNATCIGSAGGAAEGTICGKGKVLALSQRWK